MKLVQNYLVKNRCYINATKITVKGIMVHSTGVSQSDVSPFLKNWNNPTVSKCVHAFVTEDNVVQTLPWEYKAWHCGGSGNSTYIGFEILEPSGFSYSSGANMKDYDVKKNTPYFNKVYQNAVELCAMLCEKYKLDPLKDIICHTEGNKKGIASNHADVMHWFPKHGKDMNQFRKDVKAQMAKGTDTKPDSNGSKGKEYKVCITTDVLNIRKGPGTKYSITGAVKKDEVYTIVSTKDGWGELKSGSGWISLEYTKKVS